MALDPRYIVSIAFEQFMVDNSTGLPLAGGYMEFYSDDDRITPKNVYQIAGDPPNYTYVALPNPLFLSDVGTPVNNDGAPVNVYAFPYTVDGEVENYYVKVYNSAAELQFTWYAWPNVTESDNPNTLLSGYQNQLANSQFVEVNFVPSEGVTITFDEAISAQEYDIIPGWTAVITSNGSGTVTFSQDALEGSLNIQTNPPYILKVLPTGANITSIILRQKLQNNPDIWSTTTAGNGYISSCMLITSYDAQPHTLELQYRQSTGPTDPITLISGSTGTEGYKYINETILLPAGTNSDNADDGSIYIDIVCPTIGYYGVTSLQVVGLGQDNITVDYQQEPANRQKSQLFYYYQPQLNYKPIKSYLCGWDFPLNPAQANGHTVAASANYSQYVWDQTILFQSVLSTASVSAGTVGVTKGSLKISVSGACQVAVIQYLALPEIIDILTNPLSSNIVFSSDQSGLKGTISLWCSIDDNPPNINTNGNSIVSALTANGYPDSFNGNWKEIPRSSLGDAIFTSSTVDTQVMQSYGFSGFDASQNALIDVAAQKYFAIVVGFSQLDSGKSIYLKSCSVVPGYIPTIPAPQTSEEVLRDCEYYYEKSYESSTLAGTATSVGALYLPAGGSYDGTNFDVYPQYFGIVFRNKKVTVPVYATSGFTSVIFYSTTTANTAGYFVMKAPYSGFAQNPMSSYFTLNSVTAKNITFDAPSTSGSYPQHSGSTPYPCVQIFQYVIDCRLGVF